MNPAPANSMPESPSPIPIQPPPPLSETTRSSEPAAPTRPPREVPPPRQVFGTLQPLDFLPLAAQAGPEPAERFAAAVRNLQNLLDNQSPPLPPLPSTVCIADVPARGVEWLWPGRVPIGKITLLVGDPGAGKSFIALDIAARVTRGSAWPDEEQAAGNPDSCVPESGPPPSTLRRRPASVLLLSAEDDLADTVRPRLEALDADCTRVIALTADRYSLENRPSLETNTTGSPANASAPASDARHAGTRQPEIQRSEIRGSTRILDLGRDVALLDRLLDSHPDCSLVIIDPISAYLGRAVENVNAEVRRIIAPLAELAERRRLAIVLISHLRKQRGEAIHRSMGSLAFVAAARTAWLVCKDSPTKAGYTPQRRLLLPIKNNITGDATGLACTIESHPYAGLPIVRWSTEPLDMDADAALIALKPSAGRPAEDRDQAARWLQTQLANGPRPSAEVEESAAAHGFSAITLRRAFRHLGGEAVRTGFGPQGQWHWRLPTGTAAVPPSRSDGAS